MSLPARFMVLSLLLLAATCGQRGPLTLPEDQNARAQDRAPTHSPVDATPDAAPPIA